MAAPPSARGLLAGVLAAPLLFGAGAAACLAWQSGLYANALVALLVAGGMAGVMSRPLRCAPGPLAPGPLAPGAVDEALLRTLQLEQRRLRALLDQAPAPFVTLSADGVLRAVNKAARAMFATDDRILAPPPGLRTAIAGQDGPVLRLPERPGEPARSYAVSVATSKAAGDGATRLAVLTDVQAELLAGEARVLRDLLQVLGHEIMNSLTPVTSLAESAQALLADGHAEDLPRVAAALETIGRRARGLDRFVQGYRTLARLPPPVLRPIGIGAVLRDAAALFETRWAGRVALAVQAPSPDIIARLDPELIGQALLALLANAADAALAGTGSAAGAGAPLVTLRAMLAGAGVALEVGDSGAGIPPGQEEAIFQPFFTLKPGGTGIGLGIARQIAASHGGTLVLQPHSAGQGAVFRLAL